MLVYLPNLLQAYADGQKEITIQTESVDECLRKLVENYPSLQSFVFSSDGMVNKFLNIYQSGDRIDLVLSMAGG